MKIVVMEGEGGTMVYCKRCGVLAGAPSECCGWKSHDFASTTVPVVCSQCGAIPGKAINCKGWNSHYFKPIPKPSGDE